MTAELPPRLTGNPAGLSELDPALLAQLRAAHRDGRLGYLGGGALSRAIGLPTWADLQVALLRHAIGYHPELSLDGEIDHGPLARVLHEATRTHALAPLELARLLAADDLHGVLRRALYDHPSLAAYRPTEVHCALAALAAAAPRAWPCIHTTNYDDLLERALGIVAGGAVASVHAGARRASDGPRVVHLDGFFPYARDRDDDERALAHTVLGGEPDDLLASGGAQAWAERELQGLLSSRSVLVVGANLAEPSLRRMLALVARARREASQDPARGEAEPHFFVALARDVDAIVDQMVANAESLLGRAPPGGDRRRPTLRPLADRALRILTERERALWARLGVRVLRVDRYDSLNYLLRRVRFADDEWDREHERLRAAWARRRYGAVSFDDPGLQALGTAVLATARDRLTSTSLPIRLRGRLELNVYLPLPDGTYRRVFSSIPGRATQAPRRFSARHDQFTLPEVERVLTLGAPVTSPKIVDRRPLAGEPPFEEWYNAIEGVPFFDDEAGGIPVGVVHMCSSERGGASSQLDVEGMLRLRGYLVGVVQTVLHAIGRYLDAPSVDLQRAR